MSDNNLLYLKVHLVSNYACRENAGEYKNINACSEIVFRSNPRQPKPDAQA